MQDVKGTILWYTTDSDIARPRTINFLSRAGGRRLLEGSAWFVCPPCPPAREPPHRSRPHPPSQHRHLAFRFVSDETSQKQDCNLHGTGCPASPGSKEPRHAHAPHAPCANPAFEQCVSGPSCDGAVHTYTHTLALTHTPIHRHTRAYKGACFNISSEHTHVWFPPCDTCSHKKEKKMLKITFNSSNAWGRRARDNS